MTTTLHPRHRWADLLTAAVASVLLVAPSFAQTATTPSKTAAEEEAVKLSIFTVTDEKELGYESMHTTSGMRTVQELKNVANSISVMNQQLIEDLGVTDIQEMSKWFVTGEQSPDPAQPNQLIFRGVRNSYAIRNGWIWYSPMDSYATERVELLRGPNAFLYGEADLGGANNQITKRGLFTRNVTRTKLMLGRGAVAADGVNSGDLRRVELDLNRVLKRNVLAVRFSAVQHNEDAWNDHGRRDFRGVYGAVTYRPFRSTTINLMAEHAKNTTVASQGLFLENYTFSTVTTLTNTAGVIYVPATGAVYRANTQRRSNGTGLTAIDDSVVPRTLQVNGPNATNKNYYDSVTLEIEQHVGKNLHLQISGNFYQQQQDIWGAAASRNIYRDLSPTLPGGATNPNFNELYTEYFRTRNLNGNIVRDMRFSAIYDLDLKWMKQQFAFNAQQHQDSPGQKKPKYGEYVDPSSPLFVGTINPAITQAAFTANRTTFASNRFMRRFYLKDGDGGELTGDLGPKPGVSAWFPDLSNAVPSTGNIIERRFYTPSLGVGASGSYFNNHLFTLAGYRQDHFNMKTTVGAVRALQNTWINDNIPGAFAPNPTFVQYKADGSNLGVVVRVNDMLAFAYNRAQSFRISAGDGVDTFKPGTKQGIQTGEGSDASVRLSLFGGRMEFNTTHYDNYQPNARISPAPAIAIRDEVSAIFPTTFNPTGADFQKLATSGYEVEIVANLTRTWRLILNGATNDLVTRDRLPLLKSYQAEAKALNKPTPLLDAFLLTFPEEVPTAGYTKTRVNLFTRYEIPYGRLRGLYFGGGANWREQTFRGNAVVVQGGPVVSLWSPAYYTVSLLGGYRTKIFDRATSFSFNVDNALNKDYYLSATTTTGSWGAPRGVRFTMVMDF
ncbi:MAG: TonB-dependent receptor plug domain-containing protein [Verrucomicrobia bacterium]|nr:TonB-dependent receptor plug domain-containing protein [Verrucomicrobiota bacterium]